jgi:hypothetical protein
VFIRFVVDEKDEESLVPLGVFHALGRLQDIGVLDEAESVLAKQHYQWFKDNLKTPTKFTRSKSKAPYRKKRKAISWFKDTAAEHLRRLRDINVILEQHDVRVRMITTDRPGYILYEDDFQVAAEPFADTPV